MKFRASRSNIFFRTVLVFLTLFGTAYSVTSGRYYLLAVFVPVIIFQFYDYYRFHRKAQEEVEQFVESVHYRDFSRYFDVKHAPSELQPFRSGFNEINTTFKLISKEKETQYLHLKSILEIVDTGILSYDLESGEILWMNESLKNLLLIPYLKTIHSLEKRNKDLYLQVVGLRPAENTIATINRNTDTFKILLSATAFSDEKKKYKLIAFQNINQAMDETESRAWQKLLSVMTHEIMNSVAPISSLAETLKSSLKESIHAPEQDKELLTDIETGISTIQKRSEGLLKFTEIYRNLSKITHASVSPLRAMSLFEHVQQLMQPTIDAKKIELEIILRDPLLEFNADADLVEQVMINLILNAIDAVKDLPNPKITFSASASGNGGVQVRVGDNGSGIKPEILEKIFVPFFSTKKTGSGIGLSLCKQIMLLHKGNIHVNSELGSGTVFILQFPG
jgi:two-component system nitrogen regulation sensor histidine kinase NtrY